MDEDDTLATVRESSVRTIMPRVHGTWGLIDMLGRDDRIEATALQTVGLKGWDGFAIGVVR